MNRHRAAAVFFGVVVTVYGAGYGAWFLAKRVPEPLGLAQNYKMWYMPAAQFAAGHGFGNPQGAGPEYTRFFFSDGLERLDARAVPPNGTADYDPLQKAHRYLLYAVGVTWRLFGISWQSIKVLQVAAYVASLLLLYGVMQVVMPPALAAFLAAAFMSRTEVTAMLTAVRDFDKAPFFYGVFFVMARLLAYPPTRRAFVTQAGILGALCGVGLGFRQDLLVAVPACVAVLAGARAAEAGNGGRRGSGRVLAMATFAAVFVICAAPVLNGYRQGANGPHQIIMGFATRFDEDMGMRRASYERLMVATDNAATISRTSYVRRVDGTDVAMRFISPEMRQAGTRFVTATVAAFPGDMIGRVYACALWVMRCSPLEIGGAGGVPAAGGLIVCGLALCGLALRGPGRAILVGGVLLVFAGSISLQFEARHAFYLEMVPSLALGGCVWAAAKGVGRAWQGVRAGRVRVEWASFRRAGRNLALFLGVAVFLPGDALAVTRLYQQTQVMELVRRCMSARLERIETTAVDLGDVVLFRVVHPETIGRFTRYKDLGDDYAVVAYDAGVERLGIAYDTGSDTWNTFRADLIPVTAGAVPGEECKSFFPVYNIGPANDMAAAWSQFAGIVVSKKEAAGFHGLYRVEDRERFSLLPVLTLRSSLKGLVWKEELTFAGHGPGRGEEALHELPAKEIQRARTLAAEGKKDEAAGALTETVRRDPGNLQAWMELGHLRESCGSPAGAEVAYHNALERCPEFAPARQEYDRLVTARKARERVSPEKAPE